MFGGLDRVKMRLRTSASRGAFSTQEKIALGLKRIYQLRKSIGKTNEG